MGKKLLIGAISFVLICAVIFCGVMTMFKWDFTRLSTVKYETNVYSIDEEFSDISISTNTANIEIIPTRDPIAKVVCYEAVKLKHSTTVKDGELMVEFKDERKWYDHISLDFRTAKITLYLPKGEYGKLKINSSTGNVIIPEGFNFENIDISQTTGNVDCFATSNGDVKIKASTGDIKVEKGCVGSLSIEVSTGNILVSEIECAGDLNVKVSTGGAKLSNVNTNTIISSGDTGDISLKKVIAAEGMTIERNTGNVKFEECDAQELVITTDTGDVKGTLLSDKVFIVKSDTGSVKVPETTNGGTCKITTDTGDVKIEIK